MEPPENPGVETTRKVITFPPPAAETEARAGGAVRVTEAEAMRRRRQLAQWLDGMWLLFAWILAASRLSFAVSHRQVFGAEASTAFLLVVSMPLIRARRVAAKLRGAISVLRSANRAGRAAESARAPDAVRAAARHFRARKSGRKKP
jgi:hypothetical protein